MDNNLKISMCGDHCSECPRYLATQANDSTRLNELAELWSRLGYRTEIVSVDSMKCYGCSKDKPCSYNINSCEHISNLQNCGECKLFPCGKINLVFDKTEQINDTCLKMCSPVEYAQMKRAFLMKREVLTRINRSTFQLND